MNIKNPVFLRVALFCLLGICISSNLHARKVNIHIVTSADCTIDIVGDADGGGMIYQNFTGTVTFGGGPDCPHAVINFNFVSPPDDNDPTQPSNGSANGITSYLVGGSTICSATNMVFSGNPSNSVSSVIFQDAVNLLNLNSSAILGEMKRDMGC